MSTPEEFRPVELAEPSEPRRPFWLRSAAEERAKYGLPEWVTDEDIEMHGAGFIACTFRTRAHWQHYLRTGDMRQPATVRRAAKIAADPVAVQKEVLRKRVSFNRRAIRDAEEKIADARAVLAEPYAWNKHWRAEETVKTQMARIEERQRALKTAELDLALFDELHAESIP